MDNLFENRAILSYRDYIHTNDTSNTIRFRFLRNGTNKGFQFDARITIIKDYNVGNYSGMNVSYISFYTAESSISDVIRNKRVVVANTSTEGSTLLEFIVNEDDDNIILEITHTGTHTRLECYIELYKINNDSNGYATIANSVFLDPKYKTKLINASYGYSF